MPRGKIRPESEKRTIAATAIEAKKNGIPFAETAKKFGVHPALVRRYVNQYQENDTENALISAMSEGGLKTMRVLIFSIDDKSDSFFVEIDQPEFTDFEEFQAEVERRSVKKIAWSIAGRKFK
jgi:hypothetical protein